jgi:hypothetical protein
MSASPSPGGRASGSVASSRELLRRARALLPWSSLVYGIWAAVSMDRRPERAWWVVSATLGSWLAMWLFLWGARLDVERLGGRAAWVMRAARFGARWTTQSALQMALFFSFPFYVRAAASLWGHAAFLAVLGVAAGVTLWDPWYGRILAHPTVGAVLQAFATCIGLNVVLPILGLGNDESLSLATLGTAAAVPVTVWLGNTPNKRLRATLAALLVPGALSMSVIRHSIPAAPMRLARAGIGTVMRGWELQDATTRFEVPPAQLVCFTSVWAPRGLKDALYHVWTKDGRVVDRVALIVRGGDASGFRTWSIKQQLGKRPGGTWTCTVETAAGQRLGSTRAEVAAAAPAPAPSP